MSVVGARLALGAALLATGAGGDLAAQTSESTPSPDARYWAFVANESSDLVSLVRFGPEGAALERDIPVGLMPADLDAPHGLTVTRDGRHVLVSLAHGTPFGRLWKLDASSGALVDSTTLGRFPASVDVSPDGSLAFVANFNVHGDHVPSDVSAVFLPALRELARIQTCVMPHGSRVNLAGTRHYSVCMMDDQLVEIDIGRLEVVRRMALTPGNDEPGPGAGLHDASDRAPAARCGPTWVVVSPDDRRLYVACNRSDEVIEVDVESLEVLRRFRGGRAPYNLATTASGDRLLATNRADQSVSVFDLGTGGETARIATSRPITHGVAITPDDRYAFVSNEAVGATRGTVDVIELERLERVATVEVHLQAGGIDIWRTEPAIPPR